MRPIEREAPEVFSEAVGIVHHAPTFPGLREEDTTRLRQRSRRAANAKHGLELHAIESVHCCRTLFTEKLAHEIEARARRPLAPARTEPFDLVVYDLERDATSL